MVNVIVIYLLVLRLLFWRIASFKEKATTYILLWKFWDDNGTVFFSEGSSVNSPALEEDDKNLDSLGKISNFLEKWRKRVKTELALGLDIVANSLNQFYFDS